MSVFSDDFERANGAPGGAWSVSDAGIVISGGALSFASGLGFACNTSVSDSAYREAEAHISTGHWSGYRAAPVVCMSGASGVGFALHIYGEARPYYFRINSTPDPRSAVIANVSLDVNLPPMVDLRLVWDNGHLSGYYQGTLLVEGDSSANFNAPYCGLTGWYGSSLALDFRAVGSALPSFSVDPLVVGNYGVCVTVALAGSNTAWTSGTPGAPTFTVNHGAITAQTVIDATHATLTYCPGDYLGAVVFADPSSGATAGAVVTSDPSIVPPTGTALSDAAIAYIERSAAAEEDSIILNRNESWTGYGVTKTMSETIETVHNTLSQSTYALDGQAGILALIIQVYDLLNGGSDWGGAATVFGNTSLIKADVDTLAATLADVQGPGGVSLAVLAAALSDLRGVGSPSLADVLAASGGGDSTAILEAIAAVRGAGSPSLATLLSSVAGIRTGESYDLGTVKTWIDAIPRTGDTATALAVVSFVAALALAIPTGGASVAAEAVVIGAGPLLDIATLVEVVGVLGELAGIASNIASIRASLATPTVVAAPVWPGADLVTLGASHDLADGLIVDGPMHGLLVTIGGHPSGAGKYSFGSVDSWQHCGAIIFQDDSGHYERAESFGLPSQILTPHTMASAASATVRLNGGWSGTIRGWRVTA